MHLVIVSILRASLQVSIPLLFLDLFHSGVTSFMHSSASPNLTVVVLRRESIRDMFDCHGFCKNRDWFIDNKLFLALIFAVWFEVPFVYA